MDSVTPSAAEWRGMPESHIYQEDGRVGRGVTDAIVFTVDAPPKPTVEELLSYGYHVKAWSNRPQPSRPEKKYMWKAVSERSLKLWSLASMTVGTTQIWATTAFALRASPRSQALVAPAVTRRVSIVA